MTMIPTPDEAMIEELRRAADALLPMNDEFTAAGDILGADSLVPRVLYVYMCENCGCRYMPDRDDGLWYRDRFMPVAYDDSVGCEDTACACHGLPCTFRPLPGHCATCEASLYEDGEGHPHHYFAIVDTEHSPIHVVPVTEQDMDDLKQGLLRIEHDLSN
jgi:hypothetical protein